MDQKSLDKLLQLESIQSNEWRRKKSILCRRTAEILRDTTEFKEWSSTVPDDFAYLPYDIAEDIINQNRPKSVANFSECDGIWGQAVGNVKLSTIHNRLQVREITVASTVARNYDSVADKKLIFRETILEDENLSNYIDLAPRMCGILSVSSSKAKNPEEEHFYNALSTKFARISLELRPGVIPLYVEAFLTRAIYGRHLRSLVINQKSEDLIEKLAYFVTKPNFEGLETQFYLPYLIFETAYSSWTERTERTSFRTARQRFEFQIDELTFCQILSLFADWTEDRSFDFDFGFANIEMYNKYHWRRERHAFVEGRVAEMALRTRDVTEECTYSVLMLFEEGEDEDFGEWEGLFELAQKVRADEDSYFGDEDDN